MKLTEMKGASLLPVRKFGEGNAEEQPFSFGQVIGHNSAVTQLEQCSVEVDCEELAKLLENNISVTEMNQMLNGEWNGIFLAKALSKCKQNWLRLERNV